MYRTTEALVLREVKYKEADRILTLLTRENGKMTVKARGALRKNSKMAAATQMLTLSEMTFFGNRERWTVNEASVREPFRGLREDIESLALGCYFAECAENLSMEDQPEPELMQLILNSLYALSNKLYAPGHIKAVFELRLMQLSGYEPALDGCAVCGRPEPEDPILGLSSGCVCCRGCRNESIGEAVRLPGTALQVMRRVLEADPKRIFSFRVQDPIMEKQFHLAAERYLLAQTERHYGTLDYWKSVRTDTQMEQL